MNNTLTSSADDLLVYIGRFSPVHLGHLHIIREALTRGRHLCILVGSAFAPRTPRTPFTVEEREQMLRLSLTVEENARVTIKPLPDVLYNDQAWIELVQTAVRETAIEIGLNPPRASISLIGHRKDGDATSYYLNKFPQWGNIGVENYRGLDATRIRTSYFSNAGEMWLHSQADHVGDRERDHQVDAPVRQWLAEFMQTDAYCEVVREVDFMTAYRLQWKNVPYEVVFQTVDAVVVQAGHVLLVERGAFPGIGQFALPGGFLNPKETLEDGMIRELTEETGIAVSEDVLRGSIRKARRFDDPNRSSRGRTITEAFLIQLPTPKPRLRQKGKVPVARLPKVKGGDDAQRAFWLPLADVRLEDMFEDHAHIIRALTAEL